jgi:hypothetical protein
MAGIEAAGPAPVGGIAAIRGGAGDAHAIAPGAGGPADPAADRSSDSCLRSAAISTSRSMTTWAIRPRAWSVAAALYPQNAEGGRSSATSAAVSRSSISNGG